MFEDSVFESTGSIHTRSRSWMLLTTALNGALLLALVLFPLLHPEALPRHLMLSLLNAPPPPAAETSAPSRPHKAPSLSTSSPWSAPTQIAHLIPRDPGPPRNDSSDADMESQLQQPSGVPGGDLFRAAPLRVQPPPPARSKSPVQISSGVAAGLILLRTVPNYPPLAKAVRVEGVVALQATITANGSIENVHVLSGPAMLQQSAIDAVRQWRYRPFLLNGEPVAVTTTINVIYTLGH